MVAVTTAAARTAAYRATIIITISNYPTIHLCYFLDFLKFRLMYRHSGSVAIPASNYVLKILEKILMNVLCWYVSAIKIIRLKMLRTTPPVVRRLWPDALRFQMLGSVRINILKSYIYQPKHQKPNALSE